MTRVALIGGTGSATLVPPDAITEPENSLARFGVPSTRLRAWSAHGHEVYFLSRHGEAGRIPPHRVNYRANIQLISLLGPTVVIGLNAVGGITSATVPGRIVIPDQLIDYTWGREHTYFDGSDGGLRHIEFDPPFDETLRAALIAAGRAARLDAMERGTYGVTQGPRLETAAEIDRLAGAGCDVVGMTAMPEAGLARELGLRYAIAAAVVNRAAGRLPAVRRIHAELETHLAAGVRSLASLLDHFLQAA